MTTPSNAEFAALKAEWNDERDAFVATLHPDFRPLYLIGMGPFSRWLDEQGYEVPPPDFGDPYIVRRFAEYEAWRDYELRNISPEALPHIAPCFMPFCDWLDSEEVDERLYGSKTKT